jgi:DNA-binding Xre family transcriptional regulator
VEEIVLWRAGQRIQGALALAQHDLDQELAERVDVTVVNLSILKNGRARAIRFSTLTALCQALGCQPGELLSYQDSATSPD